MWLNDPFKRFLRIYGMLVLSGILILVLTRQEIGDWFLETSAYPLLESEISYIEEIWYSEGEAAVREGISSQHSSLFHYQFREKISQEEYNSWYNGMLVEDTEEQSASMVTYLPNGNQWQSLYVSINRDYFGTLFSTFNYLILSVAVILLLGFIIAFLMIRSLKARLMEINLASQTIRQTNDLSERIPVSNLTGPLAETITQINQMLDSIETSVTATKTQANNIAHDLRTPITAMYNKVQKITRQYPEFVDLELMLQKLLATFNLLLRINRLESDGESIQIQPTNIADVILDVEDLYTPVLEDNQQQLRVLLTDNHTAIANTELLFQALCNLIDNSSKFAPPDTLLEIKTLSVANELRISITDQGGGVEKDNLVKLCNKFYREDKSRNTEGNGLGLSFVSAAVQKMSGRLEVSNELLEDKHGLCITLVLKAG